MANFHKHQSWGRTRRPKNLTGIDGVALGQTAPGADSGNIAAPGTNDAVVAISSVQAFTPGIPSIRFTMGTDPAVAGLAVGNQVQISAGPEWLRNRSFPITAVTAAAGNPANTVTIQLDGEAAHQAKFLPASGLIVAGHMRRRTTLGYKTENQRYLHLSCVAGSVAGVHVYNYAVGKWVELVDVITDDQGAAANDAAIRRLPIAMAAGEHRIIDIMGADRVSVVIAGGATAEVYGATSTF